MDVNKIKIVNKLGDKEILLPLSTNWDLSDREASILEEQTNIIKTIIGKPTNYELQRFSRQVIDGSTYQQYQFNFYNTGSTIWEPSYLNRFPESLVRYTRGSFAKSFFKLDLYDTTDPKKQKIYLSIILPTSKSSEITSSGTLSCKGYVFTKTTLSSNIPQPVARTVNFTDCCGVQQTLLVTASVYGCVDESQPIYFTGYTSNTEVFPPIINNLVAPIYLNGEGVNTYISVANLGACECIPEIIPPAQPPNLSYPNFYLDHVGNQEGYYIYWYQDEKIINLKEFFMTAKFFDGSTGTFTRFTTIPQMQTKIPNDELYYRVILDYPNKLYKITNTTDTIPIQQVEWYEYNNPKII